MTELVCFPRKNHTAGSLDFEPRQQNGCRLPQIASRFDFLNSDAPLDYLEHYGLRARAFLRFAGELGGHDAGVVSWQNPPCHTFDIMWYVLPIEIEIFF